MPDAAKLAPSSCDDSFDDWSDEAARVETETRELRERIAAKSQPQGLSALVPVLAHAPGLPTLAANATPCPIPFAHKPDHFPAFAIRSALFGVARPDRTAATLPRTAMKIQGNYGLEFEGPRLGMFDKSVWEIAVNMAKEQSLDMNEGMRSSLSEFAKRMGCASTGSRVIDLVWDSLLRLEQSGVALSLPNGKSGSGHLLGSVSKDSGGAWIHFDPGLAKPGLGIDRQFCIDTQRRRTLESTLAQWLHDFLSSHDQGKALTMAYMRELCGFDAQKKRFPERLAQALDQLQAKAPGLIVKYEMDDSSRDSDEWAISITRGGEAASFVDPLSAAKPQRSPGGKPTTRSRVAL